jgi:hypothetical protein
MNKAASYRRVNAPAHAETMRPGAVTMKRNAATMQ